MPYTDPRVERFSIDLKYPIPVQNALFQTFWRLITLARAASIFLSSMVYYHILLTRAILSLLIRLLTYIQTIYETEFVAGILEEYKYMSFGGLCFRNYLFFSKLTRVWWFLWPFYFILEDIPVFHHNYTEAWRKKFQEEQKDLPKPDCSLIMFLDNEGMMEIPCLWDMDDRTLILHIREFYYLRKCELGIIETFGMKSKEFIEVVKLEPHKAIGKPESILELGRDRANRPLKLFTNLPPAEDGSIKQHLLQTEVLAAPNAHKCALNFVRKFNSDTASFVIAMPITISAIFSVVWVVVAVEKYGADVQASIQTGFTVGSYIVTAGALLIALIAFLDTRYDSSRRYVEGRVIGNPIDA